MNIDNRINNRFDELIDEIPQLIESDSSSSYEVTREFTRWGMSVLNLLQRVYGAKSLQFERFVDSYDMGIDGDYLSAQVCIGIFESANNDFKNGYLFTIRTLVKAELGDEILEQARSLLQGSYKDIAGVVAGISLELAIKDLCDRNQIEFNHNTKTEQLNIQLRKADVYNESMRKQVSAWLARRNHAAHGEWDEYNHADVQDLINGVERFIAEYLN